MPEKTDKDPIKAAYAKLGSRMKTQIKDSDEKATQQRLEGFEKLNGTKIPSLLPEELVLRILSLKKRTGLPETILPSSYFEKKGRRGSFLRKLSLDVIDFGRTFQRAYNKLPTSNELVEEFMIQQSHWECTQEDLQDIFNELKKEGLMGIQNNHLVFEPLAFSQGINSFLKQVWSQQKEFWSKEEISELLRIDYESLDHMLKTLVSEGICVRDEDGYWFTGFSR